MLMQFYETLNKKQSFNFHITTSRGGTLTTLKYTTRLELTETT